MCGGVRTRSRLVAGLDIGAAEVRCIVGRANAGSELEVLGMGSHPGRNRGRGPTHLFSITESIRVAYEQVMSGLNTSVDERYVSVGTVTEYTYAEAKTWIRNPESGVDDGDVRRVLQNVVYAAEAYREPILHSFVQEYRVDGGAPTLNPTGLAGTKLEVKTLLALAQSEPMRLLMECCEQAGFLRPKMVAPALAFCSSLLTPNEQERGCLVIDLGESDVRAAVYADGFIRTAWELEQGCNQVTTDIAQMLKCRLEEAEEWKVRYGCASPEKVESSLTFGGANQSGSSETWSNVYLAQIIEARFEDIFEQVRDSLNQTGWSGSLPGGAVLTGGGAMLSGVEVVGERVLGMPCRVGAAQGLQPDSTFLQQPLYATVLGLVSHGLHLGRFAIGKDVN